MERLDEIPKSLLVKMVAHYADYFQNDEYELRENLSIDGEELQLAMVINDICRRECVHNQDWELNLRKSKIKDIIK